MNHSALLCFASLLLAVPAVAAPGLDGLFADPPRAARPQVWYHWVQDRVTREGLAADVKAMSEAGISAAYVFTCSKRQSSLPSNVRTMSDEWLRLFDFFCEEAGKAGLSVGFHNCPGWTSSGGPWIRPEEAMKQLCFYFGKENTNECPAGFWREIATYDLPDGRRLTAGCRVLPGAVNRPATVSGLECDKLSKKGLDAHWAAMPAKILALPHAKDAVRACVIDSNEQPDQTWTEELPAHFKALCGYDPIPFLPVLAGCPVKDTAADERFRVDFRRTIADMYAVNYYGHFVELCHANGLQAIIEPYNGPFEYVRVGQLADVPTAEYWICQDKRDYLYAATWLTASAARLAGHVCAAETFTAETKEGRYQLTPHQLRVVGDRAWSEGINQFVIHSYVHQPYLNVKPGVTLGNNGSMLNRNTTWWPEFRAWGDYVARGQALLQSGRPVSDLLVLTGNEGANAHDLPPGHLGNNRPGIDVPASLADAGYSFDLCDARAFLRLDASAYRAVWTPDPATLAPELARRIAELKAHGIAVTHPPAAPTPADAVRSLGLKPSVVVEGNHPLRLLRRVSDDGVVFYFLNRHDEAFTGNVPLKGEVWDAKSGERRPFDGSLSLQPHESCFIVTGRVATASNPSNSSNLSNLSNLSAGWRVCFDGPGAPEGEIVFPRLTAWNEHADPRIRYFSGRARYVRRVDGLKKGMRYRLSLGEVRDVANVSVDGRRVGTLWEAPYEVGFVAPSASFELTVEVVNTWPNRMIGDARARRDGASEPRTSEGWPVWAVEDRSSSGTGIYTWSWVNFDFWKPDEPLLPAGLLGPVTLAQELPSPKTCPCADTGFCLLPAGECDSVGRPVVTPLVQKIGRKHRVIRQDAWYGGRRTVFDFQGFEAWIVEPPEGVAPAEGRPWTWTMQWKTAFVPRSGVPELLRRGFHHVTIDTFRCKMDAEGLRVSKAFQDYLVGEIGLAPKANLIGMSWGGFFSVRYAAAYPENVGRICLDNPLLDFGTTFRDDIGTWTAMRPADGRWTTSPEMPLNKAEAIAASGISVLLFYGSSDTVTKPEVNALPFFDRMQKAGGDIRKVCRPLHGHHPHGVEAGDSTIVDFFSSSSRVIKR